jgi:ParB/RepB/Spo0J family partition protein
VDWGHHPSSLEGGGEEGGFQARRSIMQKTVSSQIRYLKLSEIREPKFLLRTSLGRIEELADSIRKKGLLNPLTVRKTPEGYELVCGWRRYNALKMLGMEWVLCVVHEDLSDKDAFEVALVENVQRKELSPMEEAKAFKKYVEEYGWGSVTELAEKIGKNKSYVARRIQFLELPEEVQRMLEEDFERRLEKELESRRNVRQYIDQEEGDSHASASRLEEKNVAPAQHLADLKFEEADTILSQPRESLVENVSPEKNSVNPNAGEQSTISSQPSVAVEEKPRGFLTPTHAEVLLMIKDKPEAVKEVAQAVREKGLTKEETSLVVSQIYRGIDPKQALKNAIEQMNREFNEINEKYGHIFDGLIPSRRGIVHRLVELFTTEDFTDEEKKKIVELVNVKSLDDAVWEVKKLREKPTSTVDLEMEIAYLRKENDMLREKIAELEEQSRLREDLVVRCPFCGRDFPIREHVVA